MTLRKAILWIVAILVAGFLLLQVVPYGHAHDNPPVVGEPNWDSPRTRALAKSACFDCHSNLTKWPWYSNIAPVSWLVQRDVNSGREALNFSQWNRPGDVELDELVENIRDGSMPPWYYRLQHSDARLSQAEKDALIRGLDATLAGTGR